MKLSIAINSKVNVLLRKWFLLTNLLEVYWLCDCFVTYIMSLLLSDAVTLTSEKSCSIISGC